MNAHEKVTQLVEYDEVFVKDMSLAAFERKFPQLGSLTQKMRSHLPNSYKNYLVDFIVMDCRPGKNTCRDIRWHVDGDFKGDNKYVLWVKGPNRTHFPKDIPSLKNMPDDREAQNRLLESLLENNESLEVPEETIVSYDSTIPHKGVSCKIRGKRYFIRMMASNYIKPKNIHKEKA